MVKTRNQGRQHLPMAKKEKHLPLRIPSCTYHTYVSEKIQRACRNLEVRARVVYKSSGTLRQLLTKWSVQFHRWGYHISDTYQDSVSVYIRGQAGRWEEWPNTSILWKLETEKMKWQCMYMLGWRTHCELGRSEVLGIRVELLEEMSPRSNLIGENGELEPWLWTDAQLNMACIPFNVKLFLLFNKMITWSFYSIFIYFVQFCTQVMKILGSKRPEV